MQVDKTSLDYLAQIAKDIKVVRDQISTYVNAQHEAEMERCDDRFRQLLEEAHLDGNVFEQVRRKMADDPNNRWDHTRAIGGPK